LRLLRLCYPLRPLCPFGLYVRFGLEYQLGLCCQLRRLDLFGPFDLWRLWRQSNQLSRWGRLNPLCPLNQFCLFGRLYPLYPFVRILLRLLRPSHPFGHLCQLNLWDLLLPCRLFDQENLGGRLFRWRLCRLLRPFGQLCPLRPFGQLCPLYQ